MKQKQKNLYRPNGKSRIVLANKIVFVIAGQLSRRKK